MEKSRGVRVAIVAGMGAVVILCMASWLLWPNICSWYYFRSAFQLVGKNTQGYFEYRHRKTGIVMVRLPGGTFWMGAQKGDPNGRNYDQDAKENEGPVHEVTLSSFLIGKYEVTQAEWMSVNEFNPSGGTKDDRVPVDQVSWEWIQGFEAKTGLILPTEAQWEYAGKGIDSETGRSEQIMWGPTPVGRQPPSDFGVYDLLGNVYEWCEDVYAKDFYGKPEAEKIDPVSITGSEYRVIRGGQLFHRGTNRRISFRNRNLPSYSSLGVGFRVVYQFP